MTDRPQSTQDTFIKREERKWFPVIESKVKAASFVATVAGGIIGWLGEDVFMGNSPSWVAPVVGVVVSGVCTFIAGFLAKHTPR